MKDMTVEQIAEAIGASGEENLTGEVNRVVIDSRKAVPGSIFFAIRGDNFDGHDYIQQALESGAVCAVSSRQSDVGVSGVLVVDDTVESLGTLANYYRNLCGFKVVAITGSAGKTSTRQIVHHVLSKHFRCHQASKSFNNNIGLPLTILGADGDCDIVITEMGTNNPGEIEVLSRIAEPDAALVNNIFAAHLLGLKNIEGVITEKSSIAAGLKSCGKFLVNGDFPKLVDHCRTISTELITFGTTKGCDIIGKDLSTNGITGTITIDKVKIDVPLPGRGNLANTLAAFAICRLFGIDAQSFAADLQSLSSIEMRMEVESFGEVTVINDCYNANPVSMNNAVEALIEMAGRDKRRSVFICGHMGELGDFAEQLHVQLGETIGREGVEVLISVGPFAEIVADSAKASSDNTIIASSFEDTAILCENLNELLLPDDIILIKGSRAGRLEKAADTIAARFK